MLDLTTDLNDRLARCSLQARRTPYLEPDLAEFLAQKDQVLMPANTGLAAAGTPDSVVSERDNGVDRPACGIVPLEHQGSALVVS